MTRREITVEIDLHTSLRRVTEIGLNEIRAFLSSRFERVSFGGRRRDMKNDTRTLLKRANAGSRRRGKNGVFRTIILNANTACTGFDRLYRYVCICPECLAIVLTAAQTQMAPDEKKKKIIDRVARNDYLLTVSRTHSTPTARKQTFR